MNARAAKSHIEDNYTAQRQLGCDKLSIDFFYAPTFPIGDVYILGSGCDFRATSVIRGESDDLINHSLRDNQIKATSNEMAYIFCTECIYRKGGLADGRSLNLIVSLQQFFRIFNLSPKAY